MSRKIKFRAWDGAKRVMHSGMSFIEWLQWSSINYKNSDIDECGLMQFTGLSDKHGKEIYEGDVVEDSGRERFVVGWNEKGFWELLATYDTNPHLEGNDEPMGKMNDTEVIGNIYESPDILK